MATEQSSNHYRSQVALATGLAAVLKALWPSLDLRHLPETVPGLKLAVLAVTNRFGSGSGSLASRDYERRRLLAGIRSGFTVPVADVPSAEQVAKVVDWAVRPLWNQALLDAAPTSPEVVQALDAASINLTGGVEKMVLDVGRQTTLDAVAADRRATSWARETKPGCCYFCALMASRGAAYRSAGSAGLDANERFVGDGNAKFHDHCRCIIVPQFGKYEPTADARGWAQQYDRLKKDLGRSPSLLEWRQHFGGQAS